LPAHEGDDVGDKRFSFWRDFLILSWKYRDTDFSQWAQQFQLILMVDEKLELQLLFTSTSL